MVGHDTSGQVMITISLSIENNYQVGKPVTTTVTDAVVQAPPANESDWHQWSWDHLYRLTGTGHCVGESWYDVTVTASTDPRLVGRTFDFGY